MAISQEDILEAVGNLTVMELNDLVKAFEESIHYHFPDDMRKCISV